MSGDRAPKVSIGMPVYNGAAYICEALDSVLAQTYQNFELIISDNGSTDGTEQICIDYSKKDGRIKFIRQSENLGSHWNFKFVVKEATGPLFTFLAHDDILLPDFIETSVQYLSQHPKAVLVASDFSVIDQAGTELYIEELKNIRDSIEWPTRCAEFFKYPISNVYFCIYGMMKSGTCKLIFQSIPEPTIMAGSELPILARFATAGEIASIPVVLRGYRKHAASIYMSELAAISKSSMAYRMITMTTNVYRRRLDQWATLISSTMPLRLKLSIGFRVITLYISSFIRRAFRLLIRILRRLK